MDCVQCVDCMNCRLEGAVMEYEQSVLRAADTTTTTTTDCCTPITFLTLSQHLTQPFQVLQFVSQLITSASACTPLLPLCCAVLTPSTLCNHPLIILLLFVMCCGENGLMCLCSAQ
jgi:hypothetical protein